MGRLLGTLVLAVALILFLILVLRVQAFLALLLASVFVGVASGSMNLTEVGQTVVEGMGSSLGFIATIVGLGAIFGAMVEHSGGAQSLANGLLKIFGDRRASWAMVLTGFIISISVFLDVALVILAPLVYALSRRTGKSTLHFALPLLAGMVVTHSFVPPTPGPTWVAYELGVPLGTVILYSGMVGLPTAIIVGIFLSGRISRGVEIDPPDLKEPEPASGPSFGLVAAVLVLPIILMIGASWIEQGVAKTVAEGLSRKARGAEVSRLLAEAPLWKQGLTFIGIDLGLRDEAGSLTRETDGGGGAGFRTSGGDYSHYGSGGCF